MTASDVRYANWKRSMRCGAAGKCVEVAFLPDGLVAVRRSSNPDGSVLVFTAEEWDYFLVGARDGEFDAP